MIRYSTITNDQANYQACYDPSANICSLETSVPVDDLKPHRISEYSMFFLTNVGTLGEIEWLFPKLSEIKPHLADELTLLYGTPVLEIDSQMELSHIFWNKENFFLIFNSTRKADVKIESSNLTYYAVGQEIVALSCNNFHIGTEPLLPQF